MESQGGVTRFIRRQRLLESRALLSDPACETSIAAIAEDFCFTDAAGFSRAFRREFGVSPRDVRAAVKAGLIPAAVAKGSAVQGKSTFSEFIQAL